MARPALTKRQRKVLGAYMREVADQLQLRDWTLHLQYAPCAEGSDGECVVGDGAREAAISFGINFMNLTPEQQRETVVHELLHVVTGVTWRMVQTDLAEPLGKVAYYVYCDSYRRAMEFEVDALAKSFAPFMPLIDWDE